MSDGRPDTCEDIFYPNSVIYNISLEALPSYCERTDAGSAQVVRILYIGFGVVTVNISVHCSCACEANRVRQYTVRMYMICALQRRLLFITYCLL